MVEEKTIIGLLREILPNSQWRTESRDIEGGTFETIELPAAPGADYSFRLHSYPDGEKGISAQLPNSAPETYFWFKAFEAPDYKNDVDSLNRDFLAVVETVLTRDTVILQKRGLIWNTFRLAYRVGDQGRVLSWHAGLRVAFAAPKIRGPKHTYRSGPLGRDRSMDPQPDIKCKGSHVSLFAATGR